MLNAILTAAASGIALLGTAFAQSYAITNAELHLTDSDNLDTVIEGGTIVIARGEIVAVGANVTVPRVAEVIDAGGMPVTPGLFAALSGLGLEEISLNNDGNDRRAGNNAPASAALRASDGLYYDATVIPISRVGGVTRAVSVIDPGPALFGGCGAVIDLTGSPDALTKDCVMQMAVMGNSGAGRAGGSRPGGMAAFRGALNDAMAYKDDPRAYRASMEPGRLPAGDAEALAKTLDNGQVMYLQVHGASDIRRVVAEAAAFDLNIVLVGAAEAWRVADLLAAADIPVILNPMNNLPSNFETFGATLRAAGILEAAGVDVAFYDDDIGYTHNLRLLPQLAGNAVANGMSHGAALAAITLVPAQIVDLDDELGTLERGKRADVVVWDGDPLEVTSRPRMVFIDGVLHSMDNRQSALADRYRTLPPASARPIIYQGTE